jgi:phosphoenolpyruvate carboxylase
MKNILIEVSQWYDVVSPESASEGDYESTGNEFESENFRADEIEEAVEAYMSLFHSNMWDGTGRDEYVDVVQYSADPSIDYKTGHQYQDRIVISVVYDSVTAPPEVRALIAELNDRITAAMEN